MKANIYLCMFLGITLLVPSYGAEPNDTKTAQNSITPDIKSEEKDVIIITPKRKVNIKETPLHIAALQVHLDLAKKLIENGAYIYARNKFNRTPLDNSIQSEHHDITELLSRHEAKE